MDGHVQNGRNATSRIHCFSDGLVYTVVREHTYIVSLSACSSALNLD
jgi:hypothetical protein